MTKADLVSEVAQKSGVSQKEASNIITSTFTVIKDSLAEGETVNLSGFGVFSARIRAERAGINPKTGEKISISESKVPVFKPAKALKDAIN